MSLSSTKKTGWRHQAYAPIGEEARYAADVRRGWTWSICAAMTLNGWLSCTGIKEGYYNGDDLDSCSRICGDANGLGSCRKFVSRESCRPPRTQHRKS